MLLLRDEMGEFGAGTEGCRMLLPFCLRHE
jgi:hypothetical protein